MLEKLSPAAITRKAEYRKPGRYADGGGLYLQVTPKRDGEGVTRAWLFQYSWQGRVRQMGLGSFVNVSLAQARKRAKAARDKLADGIDPIGEKKAERRAATIEAVLPQTFEAFATEYITTHSPSWRNEIHRKQWTSTLKAYAHPIIGRMNVADIETSDVLRVLKPIWASKLETADRVRGRIEKILHAAKAAKLRAGDNPAIWKNHLDHLLPSKKKNERHHPAMPYTDLPDFVRDLVKRDGIAPRALEMLILTVARTGSLIGMQDRELDLRNAHTWTIPGARMKGGREHVVPLCDRAQQIVKTIAREKGKGLLRGVRYIIHQPTPELLRALDKYGGIVSRVDIAFDIFPLHLSLDDIAALIRSNTLLRWRALGRMNDCKTTLYWVEEYRGCVKPDRNLAEYHDKPSKLDGRPAVHLELRLQTSDAVKAENLYLPSDLEKLNPRELFDKHISVMDFQRHIQRDILDSSHKTRTRGFYDRFYENRVQILHDSQPRIVKRLKALNSRFRIDDQLTGGAASGDKDHLTWKQRDDAGAIAALSAMHRSQEASAGGGSFLLPHMRPQGREVLYSSARRHLLGLLL